MTLPAPFSFPLESLTGTLDSDSFRRLAALIQSRCGIKMPPAKKTFLEGRLRRRVQMLGMASFADYCRFLFEEGGLLGEEEHLIDAITTNKTDFFRESHHFSILSQRVLPELYAENRYRPVRLWSAGCSNGAEPYSMAMTCQEFALQTPGFSYHVLASDICLPVLHEAVRAIYPHSAIEPVALELRKRYLLRDDEQQEVRIVPELRRMVSFRRLNMIEGSYDLRHLQDVIFCRNLLIYFEKATQRSVLHRLCTALRPGGYLFLGHSESISGFALPLETLGGTVFRKQRG